MSALAINLALCIQCPPDQNISDFRDKHVVVTQPEIDNCGHRIPQKEDIVVIESAVNRTGG